MKRFYMIISVFLLTMTLLTGCIKPQTELPISTKPSVSATDPNAESSTDPETVDTTIPASETGSADTEGVASSCYTDAVYATQIERYYTAVSQQWDENAYWDHEMSSLAAYYYEGTPLENVGFTFIDLDRDGICELVIGAIMGAQRDPLVFEIWTLRYDEPVMLAQSGSHNRYYLQYSEEDDLWSVAYEAENGAANHAVYYLHLVDGEFRVIQGIVFDAIANENDPWFMAYDLDWDVSNDIPIDENTATAVITAGRKIYTAQNYIPYSQYK